MKIRLMTVIALTGALALPFSVLAADSMGTMVDDSAITTKIKADYASDKSVSAMKVKVDTDHGGVVTLSGTAKTQAEVDKAVAIAKATKGVTSVKNDIVVSPN
jgi:hyperosmotically inducible periplasmic protein